MQIPESVELVQIVANQNMKSPLLVQMDHQRNASPAKPELVQVNHQDLHSSSLSSKFTTRQAIRVYPSKTPSANAKWFAKPDLVQVLHQAPMLKGV
jgi:hypothetical protein